MTVHKDDESDFGLDLNHIIKNCGFPTFDEFRKNPDKWRKGSEDLFKSIEGSSHIFRKFIKNTKYMWKNHFICKSLEQIERIAKEEGFKIDDLEMCPKKVPLNGMNENAGVEVIIQIWPKNEFSALGGKVVYDV